MKLRNLRLQVTGQTVLECVLLFLICPVAPASVAFGAQGAQNAGLEASLWHSVSPSSLDTTTPRGLIAYRTVGLDEAMFLALLGRAPMEFSSAAAEETVVMEVPWPDGTVRRFRIEESPIMQPALAERYPELKTYRGQGMDNPTATLRFDWTPQGLHAMVLAEEGTIYVEPYSPGDRQNYLVYRKADYLGSQIPRFECLTRPHERWPLQRPAETEAVQSVRASELRSYRLAVAATGEYTNAHGGTKASAVTEILKTVNRINGIYERDVAVRMVLVDNDEIVFTDPSDDPYTDPTDVLRMVDENQVTLDARIGAANYDLGHVFSIAPSGGYAPGDVCNDGILGFGRNKAKAVSGLLAPFPGEPFNFDVDVVAHEIGHQFGANHSFNATTGRCGLARVEATAFEPGSGSTIMSYAGACGSENIQTRSDDYFHAGSLDEIVTFITEAGGNDCGNSTQTGNTPPTVFAGADFVLPRSTLFLLNAFGSDTDGDALTYTWEQMDAGNPAFRSIAPAFATSRLFPTLPPDSLPASARTLNFRVTARDNRAGGGGTASDDKVIEVDGESGPFAVTQPNTAVTWAGGSTQVVTWDVANTVAPPVNCTSVKISLSLDGGMTFPLVLVASTPNDGGQAVTVPNLLATAARIKVEALGNLFFDVSDQNFTIQGPGSIELGQTVNGNLSSSAPPSRCYAYRPSDRYRFMLSSPTTVTIEARSAAFNTQVCLVNASENVVDSDDDSGAGTDSRLSIANLGTGTYYIEVATLSTGNAGGSYSLSLYQGFPSGDPISLGQTLAGTLSSTAPESRCYPYTPSKRFQFNLSAPTTITMEVTSAAFDPNVCLLNASNNYVADDNNSGVGSDSRLSVRDLSPGTYYIEVATWSTGNVGGPFGLSLYQGFPSGDPISLGQTLAGTLSSTAPESRCYPYTPSKRFQFNLSAPTTITMEVTSAAFDPNVCLLNASNNYVADDNNSGVGSDSRLSVRDLSPGTYYIEVATWSTGNVGGPFGLSLYQGFPSGDPISLGQTLAGTLSSTAPESRCYPYTPSKRYQFNLSAPTTITMEVTSAAFDPNVCLLNASNNYVADDNNSGVGSDSRLSVRDLSPGTYYIEVATWSAGNAGGPFGLSLYQGFPPGDPISLGQTLAGTLSSTAPESRCYPYTSSKRYQFNLSARTTITMEATSAAFDPNVCLLNALNNYVADDNNSGAGSDSRLSVRDLSPGIYYIEVATWSTGNAGGPFGLTLYEGFPPGIAISDGQTLAGTLSSNAPETQCYPYTPSDRYQFVLSAPTTLTIDAVSPAFDTFLCLLNAANRFVASDDDSGGGTNARISRTDLPSGRYYIELATRSAGNFSGSYTLALSAPQPPGITVSPTSGLVTTEAGGMATFSVVLNSTPTTDVTIPLSSSDTSEGTVARSSLTFAPANALTPQTVTVTGVDDTVTDGNISYTIVTGAATSTDTAYKGLNAEDVSVTNTDNDVAGIVVSPTSGLVTTEAGGMATFTVVLMTTPTADVTLGLSSSDTTEGVVSPSSLTFSSANAGTPQPVTVRGVDDTLLDGDVPYVVLTAPTVSTDAAYDGLDAADVSVTNRDNDQATIQFGAAAYSVAENGGFATITVTRTGGAGSSVTVDFATSDGSATGGLDYVPASGTLSFGAGVMSQSFPVSIIEDSLDEPNEPVNLALSNPGDGATLGTPSAAILTILDNDVAGSLQFSLAAYSVSEGGGSALITVTHSGGTAGGVSVDYATADGSATAGSDYTAVSGTLSFAAGVLSRTFNVSVLDDTRGENNETVRLLLSNPGGGAVLGARVSATLTIVENDAVLQLAAPQFSGKEGVATAAIAVKRSGATNVAASVSYTTTDATALAGSDFTAVSGTLSFAAGVVSRSFTVPVLNDALSEGPEFAIVSLSAPVGGVLGPQDTSTLLIADDDSLLSFGLPTYTATEGGPAAVITVRRSGIPSGTVTVESAMSDGTATAGDDYTPAGGLLTFNPGVVMRTFTVPLLDDTTPEPTETVNLTLSGPTGGAGLGLSSAVLSIKDNEPVLSLSLASYSVSEGLAGATVLVKRTGATTGPVSVEYATSDGSARAGSDYTATSGVLSFAARVVAKSFSIPILTDGAPEAAETVNITLHRPMGASLGLSSAVLSILDDDPSISFSAAAYTVSEALRSATITVKRTGVLTAAATVDYETSDGSANQDSDYTAVAGTLSFAPKVAARTFTVPILSDFQDEPNETLNLTLGGRSGGVIGQGTATLTITDNDVGSVLEFVAAGFGGTEDGGGALVSVKRTGGTAAGVTVQYATSDGTASAGSDYTAAAGTLTFGPGETVKTFTVPILDDAFAETTETVDLTLSNPGGGAVLGGQSRAILFITGHE